MKYTTYLANLVNAVGAPNIDTDAFRKLMNVVHLEGRNYALTDMKKKEPNADLKHKYDLSIYKNETAIRKLTGGEEPREFWMRLNGN